MADFLRDKKIDRVTLDSSALRKLLKKFLELCQTMPEWVPTKDTGEMTAFQSTIIRFDGKGYRLFDHKEIIQHFEEAKKVERLVIQSESGTSLQTNRMSGSYISLYLDPEQPNNCFLTVASNNEAWMNSSYAAIEEILDRNKNFHWLVSNPVSQFLLIILGVVLGFFVAVLAAGKIAPALNIQNAFLVSFFLALVIYNNLWQYIQHYIFQYINRLFPLIYFKKNSGLTNHWLFQGIVGSLVVSALVYLSIKGAGVFGQLLGSLIKP